MKGEQHEVEYTDEFAAWWDELSLTERAAVTFTVRLLEQKGPHLPFPYSSKINGSRHGPMRELRTQHRGRPLRVLYAFDPRRTAILLIGGDKTGDEQWYPRFVSIADRLYDLHLDIIKTEGNIDG